MGRDQDGVKSSSNDEKNHDRSINSERKRVGNDGEKEEDQMEEETDPVPQKRQVSLIRLEQK